MSDWLGFMVVVFTEGDGGIFNILILGVILLVPRIFCVKMVILR
jgi:hypothetical protein